MTPNGTVISLIGWGWAGVNTASFITQLHERSAMSEIHGSTGVYQCPTEMGLDS